MGFSFKRMSKLREKARKEAWKHTQPCPICQAPVPQSERYQHYVCDPCFEKAVLRSKRPLLFGNGPIEGPKPRKDGSIHIQMGFFAYYADTRTRYRGKTCYIDGIKCRAEEAHFGGIVIMPVTAWATYGSNWK